MTNYTIVNGNFYPEQEASLLVSDLAIQRGYGIFDFFKMIDGQLIFLEDHLDRFYHSAQAMHLTVNQSRDELKAYLYELIKKNAFPNSGIRITLTGGYSPDGYTLTKPNMIITQKALTVAKEINTSGIKVFTHPHLRQLPFAKTLDYMMAIWLQPLIKQKDADDVLYHDKGLVKECPRSNFFIVTKDNEVLTSGINVLKGIIRKKILDLQVEGLKIEEREISLDDLLHCKEAFITSSTKNILPVTTIDGKLVGDGTAGEVSRVLYQELKEVIYSNS